MSTRLSKQLSDLGADGYFSGSVRVLNQSYLSVYVSNEASQPSDNIDGYQFAVNGLLDSGSGTIAHNNWFILTDADGNQLANVNGNPKLYDVNTCTRVRIQIYGGLGSDTISFNAFVKGG